MIDNEPTSFTLRQRAYILVYIKQGDTPKMETAKLMKPWTKNPVTLTELSTILGLTKE